MSASPLYLKVGGPVVVPPVGEKVIFVDTDGEPKIMDSDGDKSDLGGGGAGTITAVNGSANLGAVTVAGVVTLTNLAAFTADTTVQLDNADDDAVNAFRSVVSLVSAVAAAEQSAYVVTLLNGGAATQALYVRGDGRTVFGAPGMGLAAQGANSITCIGAASVGSTLALGMTTPTASQTTIGTLVFYNGANPTAIISATNAASTTGGNLIFTVGLSFQTVCTMATTGLAMANGRGVSLTNGNLSFNVGSIVMTGAGQAGIDKSNGTLALGTTGAQATLIYANSTVAFKVGTDGAQIGFLAVAQAGNSVAAQTMDAVTNSVTSGGSNGVIADYAIVDYATDAAAIRNNLYQIARSLAQVVTGSRNYGLGV